MKTTLTRASETAALSLLQEALKTASVIGVKKTLVILENNRVHAAPSPAQDPVIQSYLHSVSLAFSVPVRELLSDKNPSTDAVKYARAFAVYFLHHQLCVKPKTLQALFAGKSRISLWRYRQLVETLSPANRIDKPWLEKKAQIERSLYNA